MESSFQDPHFYSLAVYTLCFFVTSIEHTPYIYLFVNDTKHYIFYATSSKCFSLAINNIY